MWKISRLLNWLVRTCSCKTCSNIKWAGVTDEDPAHSRADVNPEDCQIVNLQSGTTDTEEKFRLGSLNIGTMRGRAGRVVEALFRWKVDVC